MQAVRSVDRPSSQRSNKARSGGRAKSRWRFVEVGTSERPWVAWGGLRAPESRLGLTTHKRAHARLPGAGGGSRADGFPKTLAGRLTSCTPQSPTQGVRCTPRRVHPNAQCRIDCACPNLSKVAALGLVTDSTASRRARITCATPSQDLVRVRRARTMRQSENDFRGPHRRAARSVPMPLLYSIVVGAT